MPSFVVRLLPEAIQDRKLLDAQLPALGVPIRHLAEMDRLSFAGRIGELIWRRRVNRRWMPCFSVFPMDAVTEI